MSTETVEPQKLRSYIGKKGVSMGINKNKISRNIFLSVLFTLLLCCVFLGYGLIGNKKAADALSAVPNATSVIDPIYSFDNYCYSQDSLNQMAQQILSDDSKTITDLIDYAKRVGEKGEAIANKEITLKYGRYRFNSTTAYKQLVWLPVYLSRSSDGDAVLTLYLAATETKNGSTSRQETAKWSQNGTYSTDPACGAPTNSYGTSYLRAWALGNGGYFAGYDTAHSINYSENNAVIRESDSNKFSNFVKGSDFTGAFYNDVVEPEKITWQETESYVSAIGKWSGNSYCWPNEAYGKPSEGEYYQKGNFDYTAKNKKNYSAWKSDKVWLPSLSEVGTGNIDANGTDTTNGIWKLTNSQRSNKVKSYLRTANTSAGSTYNLFCTSANGSSYDTANATEDIAIRPAIHLNLNKIATKTIAPVNLPSTISVTYNGEVQELKNASADQISWYDENTMSIYYYEDADLHVPITPVDAGEYYVVVALRDNRYFLGEDESKKTKAAKFIVEKIQFGVTWEYNADGTPSKVTPDIEWKEKDIESGQVPVVGMLYSRLGSGGIQNSPDFPEIKDTYRATAYIINEDTHHYNYELVKDEKRIKSNAFIVSERKVDSPVFSIGGGTSLTLSYRSEQEIQFKNVTKYVTIKCDTLVDGDPEDEENYSFPDLINGIQTFTVNSVGTYHFTVSLKDPVNTMWAEGGTSDKTLTLTIEWAKITVNFDNLPSSWESNREMVVKISILGTYGEDDKDNINLNMTYYGTTGGEINLSKNSAGNFVIPRGLKVGTYTLVVRMALSSNYYLAGDMKTQKFTIVAAPAAFSDDDVYWQYTLDGSSASTLVRDSGDGKDGSSPEKAYEVKYNGNYYQFGLTMEEIRLTDLGVKASYSGDTRVSAGGSYKVTVTISAYDRNVIYNTKSYSIYFKIVKATYDLSEIKWINEGPFTFDGEEHKVMLDPDTIPEGLTVTYITNGANTNGATNAGNYTTAVIFAVNDDYAVNYEVPNSGIPESFTNTDNKFSFTCAWTIERQTIIIDWTTGEDVEDADLFFIPTLEIGHNYVDYSFEKLTDGEWAPCESVESAVGAPETYRVSVSLKLQYANNYALYADPDNEDSTFLREFVIGAGKQAVTVHLEINDTKCESGAKFVYTGTAFEAKPVIDSGNLTVNSFTVKYYSIGADGNRSEQPLQSAPVNVGKYVAVVAIKYENTDESYLSEESSREIEFEIIKADYDISSFVWSYSHGEVTISAHYDYEQKKWVDGEGKEVIFAFQYDGTEHLLELTGSVENLTVAEVTQNAYTEIGEYTAFVRFNTNDNYNEPRFPRTLSWKITKAKLNVDKVQWGYIDANGNEYEFNFEEDSFEFFRDGNGDRNYSVGLINLPEQLKDHIRYTTYCTTTTETTNGNTASQVGVYRTSYAFSGTFTDENYETFTSANMPVALPSFLFWEITSRNLTKPEFIGGWDTFDNKTRDLIELCGISSEELYFYTVEVTFKDGFGIIHNDYQGYEDVKYTGFHAGTYTVAFYQIVQSEKVLWGSVTFTVEKAKLTVAWDNQGSIPVARVNGVSVSDMLGTKYTNEYGDVVTTEYILSTDDVQFYAEPYILADYAGNIQYEMREGETEKYGFKSSQFTPDNDTVKLERPQLTFTSREYTGEPIVFAIGNWNSYFAKYLYITDGDLTQTEVGKYRVMVSFIKEANAIWEGTESNRDSYVLEFEITKPSRIYLEKPTLQFKVALYTGEPITFVIENWVEYRRYLYISVGKLEQTNIAIYTVVLNFYEDSIGCWQDGSRDAYIIQFEITDDENKLKEKEQLHKPVLQFDSATYTGSAINFVIVNWDSQYKKYLDIVGSLTQTSVGRYSVTVRFKEDANACWFGTENDISEYTLYFSITAGDTPGDQTYALYKPTLKNNKATFTGSPITFEINNWEGYYSKYLTYSGELTKTSPGVYTIVISFKEGANAHWIDTNGTESITLQFEITDVAGNNPVVLSKPTIVNNKIKFTGSAITFEISEWATYSKWLRISQGSLTQTAVGKYSVTLEFLSTANAYWEGTENDRSPLELEFEIIDASTPVDPPDPPGPGEKVKLELPTLVESSKQYTGKDIIFDINGWDNLYKNYVNLLPSPTALIKSEIGEYSVTLRIQDPTNVTWADGTTDDITLQFQITKAILTEGSIGNDGKLNVKSDSSDDYSETLDKLYQDGVIDYEYFDKDGNPVSKDDLVAGEEYTVKLVVKNRDEFNKYFDASKIDSSLSQSYTIVYEPSEPKSNTLLIVCIVCVAVELVLFIILVVVLMKKRAAANAEDEEESDEDYDE